MKKQWYCVAPIGAMAAVGLLLVFGLEASAQDSAKKAPAAKAASGSACKGLAEAACKAKSAECGWVVPKSGKQKPYCRLKTAKKK